MKYRKLVGGIAAAGLTVGLVSGCGSDTGISVSPKTHASTHAKATHKAATQDTTDVAFLSVVRPFMTDYTDAQILKIGRLVCPAIEEDGFTATAMVAMNAGGLSAYNAGQLTGAAVAAYCPQDMALLPGGGE